MDIDRLKALSGDYRVLWAMQVVEERSTYDDSSMNRVRTGTETVIYDWHVIAPTEQLARAAWDKRFGWSPQYRLASCNAMLIVDAEIAISGARSGGS